MRVERETITAISESHLVQLKTLASGSRTSMSEIALATDVFLGVP
jgi:hypothetical protein